MNSRTLEGVTGKNWIYIIYVVQNWKTGEASGQNWVNSSELHRIAGQKWQVEQWVSEIHLQSQTGAEAAMAVVVCRTGPCTFFWSTRCFPRVWVPKSQTLREPPNLQTCSVCQSPLSTPPCDCIPGQVGWSHFVKIFSPKVPAFALPKAGWWEAKNERVWKLEWWKTH